MEGNLLGYAMAVYTDCLKRLAFSNPGSYGTTFHKSDSVASLKLQHLSVEQVQNHAKDGL